MPKNKPNKDGYYSASIVYNGKRYRARSKKSQRDADKKLGEIRVALERGEKAINNNTRVEKWALEWLETYKKPSISEKNYKNYKGYIKNYIVSEIGEMSVSEVKPIHLQKILNSLAGKSDSAISFVKNIITSMFDVAEDNEIIFKNPAKRLEKPKGYSNSRRSLTDEERMTFFKAAEQHKLGLALKTILSCGLRPGEIRALKWIDVNLKDGILRVENAVESGSKNIKDTKTKAGNRLVPMPEWIVEEFRIYKNSNTSSIFVFPSSATGKVMTEKNFYRLWHSFKRLWDIELGAKVYRNKIVLSVIDKTLTPYHFRHTYATDLAEFGIDLKTAQYLMGHEDIKVTADIYTHVTNKMLDGAKEKIREQNREHSKQSKAKNVMK